jgi:hypothetical protein
MQQTKATQTAIERCYEEGCAQGKRKKSGKGKTERKGVKRPRQHNNAGLGSQFSPMSLSLMPRSHRSRASTLYNEQGQALM